MRRARTNRRFPTCSTCHARWYPGPSPGRGRWVLFASRSFPPQAALNWRPILPRRWESSGSWSAPPPTVTAMTAMTASRRSVQRPAPISLRPSSRDGGGVGWGVSVHRSILALPECPHLKGVTVVPLVGSAGRTESHYQVNVIADRMAEKLHGNALFFNIPAFVSDLKVQSFFSRDPR